METIKLNSAAAVCKLLANTNNGRFFSVTFLKKDGSIRTMLARKGVGKGVNGNGMKYVPLDIALMNAYDVLKDAHRMINLETLIEFKLNGTKYQVV